MQIDKKKLERQEQGIYQWFNSSLYGALENKSGTLHWFTGVGKTFAAILVIKQLFKGDDKHNIVILVPSEALQKQWNNILSNNFTKKELIRITVFTPNWIISNNYKIKTNTLIVDELHEFLSEEFIKTINGKYIQYDNNLGLTATYEDSKKREKLIQNIYPIIDEIGEEEALKEGYISPYVEFNLSVDLTDEEKTKYKEYSDIISQNINKFGGQLDLAVKCLQGGKHSDGIRYKAMHFVYGWASHKGWRRDLNLADPRDEQINAIWNPSKVFGYAQKLMNAIRQRKDLIYSCENKINACLDIIEKYPKIKTIIFSQSTSFADKLNLIINEKDENSSVVYHSNLQTVLLPSPKTGKLIKFGATRLKRKAMEDIKSGKALRLCTASSLDKGLDIPDIGLGITASGTSNFTQYKQRGGRTKRIDVLNNNKVALLITLYAKDTKDEDWLKKRQSKSTHNIYWIDSVEEISFTPKDKQEFTINDI